MPSTRSKTTNILTFDGGGVRGLSSLIILKRLMKYVNDQEGLSPEGLTPKDLFSLVAGTSTGGLIALMLGRFGMPVDDCIAQYFTFSEEIFGHYSKRGKWSRGLLKDRYDGNRLKNSVRKLAGRKDTCDNQSVLMQDQQHENGIPWYSDLPSACLSCVWANIIQYSSSSRV
jgi:patatin-like phospholipase/acyl hydrolase